MAVGAAPEFSVAYAKSSVEVTDGGAVVEAKVRTKFPEVWIWAAVNTSE